MARSGASAAGMFLALGLLAGAFGTPPARIPREAAPALGVPSPARTSRFLTEANRARLNSLPLTFEENRGQTNSQVQFLARGRGYAVFFTPRDVVLVRASSAKHADAPLRLRFRDANPSPRVRGLEKVGGVSNYLIGQDPLFWRTNIPRYARVEYDGLYPGVKAVFYSGAGGLEFDFIVQPGSPPQRIGLTVSGSDPLALDGRGRLHICAAGDELILQRPRIYQFDGDRREEIPGGFVVRGKRTVGFRVGAYDDTRPLILDPTLVYSTYLGGSDAELAGGVAVDNSGFVYVAGSTKSADFPTQPKQIKPGGNADFDVLVAKFDPSKTGQASLVYSSLLGGNQDDLAFGVGVDGAGEPVVAGVTASANFPVQNAFQPILRGDTDLFVTKLNASGSGFIYSTFFGGGSTEGNAKLGGVAQDTNGNTYVSSDTKSNDLFTSSGAYQGGLRAPGATNTFAAKFSPTGAVLYSTYVGGSGTDTATGVAFDGAGMIYLTGFTSSTDFPVMNQCSTLPTAFAGGTTDAFAVKLNPAASGASQLAYAAKLGGDNDDHARAVAVDNANPPDAYIAGDTKSTNFPTTTGALSTSPQGGLDAFLTVLSLNATGQACPVYSSYLGGKGDDGARGIAVDGFHKAYVIGQTSSADFPLQNPLQGTLNGMSDAFVAKLNPAATGTASLVYSTYLGGKNDETGEAVAVDTQGNAYIAGETASPDFPVTPANAFQAGCASCATGIADLFLVKISDGGAGPAVSLNPASAPFGNVNVGATASPVSISLKNTGTATLTINSILFFGNPDFSETNNCPSSLPAGFSCQILAAFTPTAPGPESAHVTVSDSASDSPQSVFLTGMGIAPLVSASPLTIDFGSRPQGTTSNAAQVTLTNSGNAPLSIASINVGGADIADFLPTSDSCPIAPQTLPNNATCVVGVAFAPKGTGPLSAELDFTDNSNNQPAAMQVIKLSGIGIPPAPVASLSPPSHDFGPVNVGTATGATNFTLSNSGNQTLHITGIQLAGNGDFAFATVPAPACPLAAASTLAPASSCSLAATFKPSHQGSEAAQIVVTDDSGNTTGATQTIALTGSGAAPVAAVSPSSFVFAAQLVGTASPATSIQLQNSGSGQLNFQVAFTGNDAGDLAEADVCGGIVNGGVTCSLMVTFAPKVAGARSATMVITDNSGGIANSQQNVLLSGAATDFAIQPASGSSSSATVRAGQSASYTLQIAPANGFMGSVTLACTGAPSESLCTPAPPAVTINSAAPAGFQINVTTTAASGAPHYWPRDTWPIGLLVAGLVIAAAGAFGKRRKGRILVPVAALIFLSLAACATGTVSPTNPGTPPGTYTLTATGSAQGVNRTLNLTLQVQ